GLGGIGFRHAFGFGPAESVVGTQRKLREAGLASRGRLVGVPHVPDMQNAAAREGRQRARVDVDLLRRAIFGRLAPGLAAVTGAGDAEVDVFLLAENDENGPFLRDARSRVDVAADARGQANVVRSFISGETRGRYRRGARE